MKKMGEKRRKKEREKHGKKRNEVEKKGEGEGKEVPPPVLQSGTKNDTDPLGFFGLLRLSVGGLLMPNHC